jgi:uncharacterized protein YqeY
MNKKKGSKPKMILDEIKKANVQALKNKDKNSRAVCAVVMTKATLEEVKKREKGEKLTDADMSQILQKTMKELDEEKENYQKAGNPAEAENIEKQKQLISTFMPKMLSDNEILDIIKAQPDKSIPYIMKFFKQNYAGKVDMSRVGAVLKNI